MLSFLNPIWLFAAGAVAIPLAIHLWNIRPGKVLKVGSITLMQAASRKSSRSLKLTDIPLLIIRGLLLVVLAMLLAIPMWQKKLQANKIKGWVLLPKENLSAAYQKFKRPIDSLTNAGFEFHYFEPAFLKADLKQILANPPLIDSNTATQTTNYWGLINELDTLVAPTLPLYLFTPSSAVQFTGQKPQAALNLHWQTYTPADSTSIWIAGAWINNSNTISVVTGNSGPAGTTYSHTDIKSGNLASSPFLINVANAVANVSLKSNASQRVTVDTTTLRVAIIADNNTDAGYLKAALQAIGQFTQRKISIKQYVDATAIPTNQSWVFWLSEKPLSDKIAQQNHNIFSYAKGRVENSNSWISAGSIFSVASQTGQKIGLYKIITAPDEAGTTAWRDGFGHPILSLQKDQTTNIYSFYSRFNPAWNDLVWSDDFPAWMLKLIFGDSHPTTNGHDKRVLSQRQIMPSIVNRAGTDLVKIAGVVNMSNYFWLILALLFLTERWLANRTQKTTTNG